MGPFALPVPGYRLGQHNQRKRKRSSASLDKDEERAPQKFSSEPPSSPPAQSSPYPQDAVINPLSHEPDTLHQFAVAGLEPEAELPSKLHPSFPHKALPGEGGLRRRRRSAVGGRAASAHATSGSEADVDTDASEGAPRSHALPRAKADELSLQYSSRVRHINTLTAMLHRFLHEGDIPRARRAFDLLLRTRDIDVRLNGLWNVGAEILMRGDETAAGLKGQGDREAEGKSVKEEEAGYGEGWGLGDEPATDAKRHDPDAPRRWGTAANTAKVTEYLKNLVQQYPYDQYRPQLTSAIDFWPALFSVEIYSVEAEFRLACHQLTAQDDADEMEGSPSPPPDAEEDEEEEEEIDYEARIRRREEAREARRWAAHDEARRATQIAAQQIAARMDGVMENRPFKTHLEMLRLRALLAFYIGDLHLPAQFVASGRGRRRAPPPPPPSQPRTTPKGEEGEATGSWVKNLRRHAETAAERVAISRREQEFDKALALFQKIERSGRLEPWMQAMLDGDGEEDDAPDVDML